MRRIAARDRGAMEELYDLYSGLLFSIAMRILNDSGEAEEVLQDVFLQVWEKPDRYHEGAGSATSWLACVTRNRAIDRFRSRAHRQRVAETLQTAQAPTEALSNADLLPDPDAGVAIRNALSELPAEQSQAIQMTFFGGLTQQQVAEALGEPLGTVKARIRRGMLKLRDSLQPYL